ncbi:hypothetical protein F5Y01DRAFT_149836 [Xylaria sp. FL0043]|nr:hypothetical protein F5Y01DRAFT_149836 [Xylaria sp. FL0043]
MYGIGNGGLVTPLSVPSCVFVLASTTMALPLISVTRARLTLGSNKGSKKLGRAGAFRPERISVTLADCPVPFQCHLHHAPSPLVQLVVIT